MDGIDPSFFNISLLVKSKFETYFMDLNQYVSTEKVRDFSCICGILGIVFESE